MHELSGAGPELAIRKKFIILKLEMPIYVEVLKPGL